MDKVTQSNAANAEESASASEEMSAQAEQMKAMVGELVVMAEGGSHDGAKQERTAIRPEAKGKTHKRLEVAAPAKTARLKTPKIHNDQEVSPQQIITLDDDDFKDF